MGCVQIVYYQRPHNLSMECRFNFKHRKNVVCLRRHSKRGPTYATTPTKRGFFDKVRLILLSSLCGPWYNGSLCLQGYKHCKGKSSLCMWGVCVVFVLTLTLSADVVSVCRVSSLYILLNTLSWLSMPAHVGVYVHPYTHTHLMMTQAYTEHMSAASDTSENAIALKP